MSGKSELYRFPLPDEWDVTDTICVTIRIPNDQQYFGTLIGALDRLKFSQSFERDPTMTGAATVSRTWKAALESMPIEFGECEVFDLRLKPGSPWITQASTDGGETWHDAIDTCACDDMAPLFPPDLSDPQDAEDAAAGMIRSFQQHIVDHILDCISEETSKTDCVNSIMDELSPYGAGGSVRATIGNIFEQVSGDAGAGQYAEDCPWEDCWEGLHTYLHDNPYAWLDDLSDFLFANLECGSNTLMRHLNIAAAQLGGTGYFNFWQSTGGGAGFGGLPFGAHADELGHNFDFSIGHEGWDISTRNCTLPDCAEAGRYAGGAFAMQWFPTMPLAVCNITSPPVDPHRYLEKVEGHYLIPTAATFTAHRLIVVDGETVVQETEIATDEGTNLFSIDVNKNFTNVALVAESNDNIEHYWIDCELFVTCSDPWE